MKSTKISPCITQTDSESVSQYFRDIQKIPLLTAQEELELSLKIRDGDRNALNKLVSSNLRFVISVAKQYQGRGVPLEDIINEGNIGLIRAAEKFDVSRGFKFISYGVWWIKQSILLCLAEQGQTIYVPSSFTTHSHKINKTSSKLEQILDREPTDHELQEALVGTGIKVGEHRLFNSKTVSIDAPIAGMDSGDTMTYLDNIINTETTSPDSELDDDILARDLKKVLNRLTVRQRKIICMYFGLFGQTPPMTLEDIGEKLNLTRERVRQVKEDALKALKCRKNSAILKQYFAVSN